MPNQLFNELNKNNLSPTNNIMSVIGMLKSAGNPAAMLQNMAQSDPAIKKAMDMCKGKNPQQVFIEQCQYQGINPQSVIGNLK